MGTFSHLATMGAAPSIFLFATGLAVMLVLIPRMRTAAALRRK